VLKIEREFMMNQKFKIDPIGINDKYEIEDDQDIFLSDSKWYFYNFNNICVNKF